MCRELALIKLISILLGTMVEHFLLSFYFKWCWFFLDDGCSLIPT